MGSHTSWLPATPWIRTTGGPEPLRRYASLVGLLITHYRLRRRRTLGMSTRLDRVDFGGAAINPGRGLRGRSWHHQEGTAER